MRSQNDKARLLRGLHKPQTPLCLYNIWDAGSAQAVERAGAKAIATSSWSVAAAQGYADGEELPLEVMLATVARIARSVNLPVTVDFEGGYAPDPETVRQNVRRLLELGVVGLNLEDRIVKGRGLYSTEDQCARIRAARDAATSIGVPAFLNARTDVFLQADHETAHSGLVQEALNREKAYARAGADGFFLPGLTDGTLTRKICNAATLPVNIMTNRVEEMHRLSEWGVARISLGPAPYIALMSAVEKEANTVR